MFSVAFLTLSGSWSAAVHASAHEVPDAVGLGLHHVVAVRYVTVVVRRQDQVLAALALVRTSGAHVAHVAEVHVVEDAQHVGRRLDDGRAVRLEVQEPPRVERGVVPGEDERLGVAHLLGDEDLVALREPLITMTLPQGIHRSCRGHVDEGFDRPAPVDEVDQRLPGVADGHAVEELERSDRGLNLVRCRAVLGDRDRVLHDRLLGDHLGFGGSHCLSPFRYIKYLKTTVIKRPAQTLCPRRSLVTLFLLYKLDLTRPPGLVDPGLPT